ncbi:class I SAM-dependent methyltransferase [Paludisphaera soli]|uniref:class I SAM-dependent methyltransferase n=1 Tax=Paludisphaera soli TaxID=2712865 RepID=UPI0013EC5368|nr:class I SAM-dependent methyltransferase [Paludisphaera soli]
MAGPGRKERWEEVYSTKAEVSWYQEDPRLSQELIRKFAPPGRGRILDVGGGASRLVDALLGLDFERVAVLDIAEAALERSRRRLGARASEVEWIVADVTTVGDVGGFDLWHDRAVFHFLTDAEDREAYVDLARRTLPVGGHLIVATFADDGPTRCSRLDVRRYDAESMAAALGDGFRLIEQARERHETPWGASQSFFYGVFRRV